jgi:DNA-binding NtrC family response regulator
MKVGRSVQNPITLEEIIGISPWPRGIHSKILQIADHSASVLISGPSGTGKELIARAIHQHGARAEKPFIPVNCATLTGPLFESRIFGHEKGAFTGAHYAAMGCLRAAHGGTIFLDEIGEMEFDMQAKLLRALQERAVMPVGSTKEVSVDVRVIVATNRNLKHDVLTGHFREDLYFRVNVISLATQALRHRTEDIELIADRFFARLAVQHGVPLKRLNRRALEMLQSYTWPGNVRELQNFIERAVLLSEGDVIGEDVAQQFIADSITDSSVAGNATLEHAAQSQPDSAAPLAVAPPSPPAHAADDPEDQLTWDSMDDVERAHIHETLQHTYFNQSAAARLLKRNRQWLIRRLKYHRLDISASRPGRPRSTE